MQIRVNKRWLAIVLSLAALQLALVLLYRHVEDERASKGASFAFEQVSSPRVLDAQFIDMSGGQHSLSELRKIPVLVHFWATWCPPCKAELPALLELGRDLQRQGQLRVVAVAVDKEWGSVRQFFNGNIPPEVVRDADAAVRLFDVSALPDSYLVGTDGSARARFAGARDWGSGAARRVLAKLASK